MCNGHGVCNTMIARNEKELTGCYCYYGWGGPDCSLRVCPGGRAWFDM